MTANFGYGALDDAGFELYFDFTFFEIASYQSESVGSLHGRFGTDYFINYIFGGVSIAQTTALHDLVMVVLLATQGMYLLLTSLTLLHSAIYDILLYMLLFHEWAR